MACATAITPAFGGRTSSVTVQRQGAAPRHLPQGEGLALRHLCAASPSKCARTARTPKHFVAERQNISPTPKAWISPRRRRDFTLRRVLRRNISLQSSPSETEGLLCFWGIYGKKSHITWYLCSADVHFANSSSVASTLWVPSTVRSSPAR